MQEWPDDKLDEFFRKSSEEFDPPYDPRDWQLMKTKLDETDPRGDVRRGDVRRGDVRYEDDRHSKTVWPALLLGIVISALLGIWEYHHSGSPPGDPAARQKEEKAVSGKPSQPPAESNRDNVLARSVPETRPPETQRPEAEIAYSERNKGPLHQNRRIIRNGKKAEKDIEALPRFAVKEKDPDIPKTLSRHQYNAGGVLIEPNRRGTEGDGGAFFTTEATVPAFTGKGRIDAPLPREYPVHLQLPSVGLHRFPDRPLPAEAGLELSRWSIRAGIAPDLSTVAQSGFSKPSLSGAVLLEYRAIGELFLQAGVARNNKIYSALPGHYNWPENWYQSIKPESVDATCRVVEIPLNLRFNFARGTRSNWYITAGTSSYRMLNEKYLYNYEQPDPRIKWHQWEGNTGWYWMSHINASAGYEKQLNRRFSVMVEPYAKIPVRKVGFGKVNLLTTGAWIYLRYNLKD